ncbi:MAG: WD40 repeat domain-containing protein [Deltaproteobacteria bacterium]|nr:WD40 repeat domain-containing protein [Deltaproteobacteria bacterium]
MIPHRGQLGVDDPLVSYGYAWEIVAGFGFSDREISLLHNLELQTRPDDIHVREALKNLKRELFRQKSEQSQIRVLIHKQDDRLVDYYLEFPDQLNRLYKVRSAPLLTALGLDWKDQDRCAVIDDNGLAAKEICDLPVKDAVEHPVDIFFRDFARHGESVDFLVHGSASDRLIVAVTGKVNVKLWDTKTMALTHYIAGDGYKDILDFSISPNGRLMALAFSDKVEVRSTSDPQKLIKSFANNSNHFSPKVRFSPHGDLLAIGEKKLQVKHTGSWHNVLDKAIHFSHVTAIAFSPLEKYIAVSLANNGINYWQIDNPTTAHELATGSMFHGIAFQDQNQLISLGFDKVERWNLENGSSELLFGHDEIINALFLDEKALYLLSGSDDNSGVLWNIGRREQIATFFHNAPVTATLIHGGMLYTADLDGVIKRWSLEKVLETHAKTTATTEEH